MILSILTLATIPILGGVHRRAVGGWSVTVRIRGGALRAATGLVALP